MRRTPTHYFRRIGVRLFSSCNPLRDIERMVTQTQKLAVNTREAAQMLSVSPRTIQNYIAAKILPVRKIGRRTVIPVRALELFLRSDHASPTLPLENETRP
jgi:excisionase family DNA binding protein